MNSILYTVIAILVALSVGSVVAFTKFRRDRREFLAKLEKEREDAEASRIQSCRWKLERFKTAYGYLGESVIPEAKINQMIEQGATPAEIDKVLKDCLRIPGFINLGSTADRPLGVILSPDLRDKHVYIIGKSGSGKTNLMRHMILQDIAMGSGVGVVAPEFEMLRDQLLPHIPGHRIKDVIYFDPTDTAYPVVLNPLHSDPGDNLDLQVDEVYIILQRIIGEGGPRMDEILRNSLYALIERPGSTLSDLDRLLDRDDHTLRNEVIRTTGRERVGRFFAHFYPQFPKDAHLPIINRIGRFVGNQFVSNCLCPPTNGQLSAGEAAKRSLNLRRAMDEGKIIFFNLSDGLLGQAASQLIGQFIVSKFQTATMSRANVPEAQRRPFYLYLDEFQNFCGTASQSYEKILSRARKYRLGLILAHQQTHQIPLPLLREVFGNVSTIMTFRVSHSDGMHLAKELGFGVQSIGENQVDPVDVLTHLQQGTCICRMGNESLEINVPLVKNLQGDGNRRRVIAQSRATFGIPTKRGGDSTPRTPGSQNPPDELADLDPGKVFE